MTDESSPLTMDNAKLPENKCASSYISEVKKRWEKLFGSDEMRAIFREYDNIKGIRLSTECVKCEVSGCAANIGIDASIKDGEVEIKSVNEGGNCVRNC